MKESPQTAILNRRLLALVRSALWQTSPSGSDFGEEAADWDALGDLAARHTVAVLALHGALSLPEDKLPTRQWIHRAYAFTERNRRTHRLVDGCVAEAVARLKDAGFSPVLLKGQAYAACYPEPSLRQCGDIDLYIGESDYPRVCHETTDYGWEEDDHLGTPGDKHYGCRLRGVRIELHRVAAQLPLRSTRRKFDRWAAEQLTSASREIIIGGTAIPVPSPIFDVVFVFLHLYLHFIRGGIGLRHLCDWVVLLHTHARTIDREELRARLKEFGLLHAWQLLGPVAVESLALSEEEFPFYTPRHRIRAAKLLELIMSEGNFGRYSSHRTPRPSGYWRGKLHTLRHIGWRMLPLIPYDPAMVAGSLWGMISAGTRHIFNDLRRGKR